ncbi:MAG: urea transporter [Candidatus Riflebacteria bacterium]|nr:urea transporter [Candidatus Riflebacteria bacterium]
MKVSFEAALRQCREIVLWYSGIFFSQRVLPGILIMFAAAGSADWGISSLLCPFLMIFWGRLFEFTDEDIKSGGYFANAILFGLYLGNTFSSFSTLAVLGFTGSFLLFILTRSLNQVLWIRYRLPTCSYPFVLIVFLFTILHRPEGQPDGSFFLKAWSYSGGRIDIFFQNPDTLSWINKLAYEFLGFVFSVGSIFFQKKFLPCLLATVALALTSRIITFMAILGYGSSRILMAIFPFFTGGYQVAYGFNAVLIGITIGGVFFVPGKKATLLMIASQIIGFFLGIFCINLTRLSGGDWTVLPFNLVLTGILLSLQGRNPQAKPMRPGMDFATPEEAICYYKRYEERIFLHSVAFPVFGRWKIVQGFNGNETHKEYWRYGVDLAAVDESASRYRSTGINIEDYYAFNAPVLSPVEGVVSAVWGEVDDNPLGEMNLAAPWGNFVIVYSAGIYVGMYHLKKASILVVPGQSVFVGTPLARTGNSGRSALPHLHLQLQLNPVAGAANIAFLFRDLLVEKQNAAVFYPFYKPEEALVASSVPQNDSVRQLLFPQNGECWHLEIEEKGAKRIINWKFAYTLYGNVIATSENGEEIEYSIGLKCVEVIRFSGKGFSPLNLFAISLSDMPFALKHNLQWQTVLFGKNAYHFLSLPKKILSWVAGDIFSAMSFKTAFEETLELEETSGTTLSIVSSFSPPSIQKNKQEAQVFFNFGRCGFLSIYVKSDQHTLLKIEKIASNQS